MTDVIDELAGLSRAESETLRGHRPDVVSSAQTSYEALLPANLDTDPVPGLDLSTRLLIAARAAHEEHADSAFEHYTARLAGQPELVALAAAGPNGQTGLTASRRLRAILRHTDTLVSRPAASTASDLAGLTAAGLDEAQIVVLSQIASFVSFQVRIVHGLAILKGTL